MKKTFNFGKVDYYGRGRKTNLVTVTVELREKEQGETLSICGEIWNNLKTDIVCGGQCLDTISEYVKTPLFKELFRFWKLYHLNDMHAGTKEQENALKTWDKDNKQDYSTRCEYLKSINLFEVEHNDKPYKYGHGWLFEAIPKKDLQRIKELIKWKH